MRRAQDLFIDGSFEPQLIIRPEQLHNRERHAFRCAVLDQSNNGPPHSLQISV